VQVVEAAAAGIGTAGRLRWLREPLLHFLILGAALFWLAGAFGEPGGGRQGRIVLTAGDLEQLEAGFERTWQRPPTQEELAGLLEDRVREEIFYREALALGLDRDDTIVRRRMRQKMEFLSEDLAAAEPSDAELESWLAAEREGFRQEPRVAFRQVYLSRDRRGEAVQADALRLLAELRAADADRDPALQGDPLPLPAESDALSASEVSRLFGGTFSARLFELPVGRWEGPVESAYGLHLVFIRERVEGRDPALAEVRDAVAREWLADRRRQAREDFYRDLRSRYEVELPAPVAAAAAEQR
jgi:parvulin-like peptidyl-prolyl cis-trans isomerase-like protein